jgi:hypothetical protein
MDMQAKLVPAQGCVYRCRPLSPFHVPTAVPGETLWGQPGGDYGPLPGDPAWFCPPAAPAAARGARPAPSSLW